MVSTKRRKVYKEERLYICTMVKNAYEELSNSEKVVYNKLVQQHVHDGIQMERMNNAIQLFYQLWAIKHVPTMKAQVKKVYQNE